MNYRLSNCTCLSVAFRLDRYRGDPKEEHKDCFDFECHIYVDDAFMKEKDTEKKVVNIYVNDLINVVMEVYRWVFIIHSIYTHTDRYGL